MLITLVFQYSDESHPATVTGVEGEVTDLILPSVGDTVRHRDGAGRPFAGTMTGRTYEYDLPNGDHLNGAVTVTLTLARALVN